MEDAEPTLVYSIAVSEAERSILENLMLRNPSEGLRLDAAGLTSEARAGLVALNEMLVSAARGFPVRRAMAIHRLRIKVLLAIEQDLRGNRGDRWASSEAAGLDESPDDSSEVENRALSDESGAEERAWEYVVPADTMLWAPDDTDPELFVVRVPTTLQSLEKRQYLRYLAESLAERGLRSGLSGEQLMRSTEPVIGETEATNWATDFEAGDSDTPLGELRRAADLLTELSSLPHFLWRGALAERGPLLVTPLDGERAEMAEGSLEGLDPWSWASKLAED